MQTDIYNVHYNIDKIEISNNRVIISGWSLVLDQDIKTFETNIVLRDIDKDVYYVIPTSMEKRHEVSEQQNTDDGNEYYNYDMSGWYATAKLGRNSICPNGVPPARYMIEILYCNDTYEILINTNIVFEWRK